jgi:8-oxo-dGTP pyrophosphatase MutT (NUDIX family)
MPSKTQKPLYYFDQSGVISFRYKKRKLEVMLITSMGGRHWIIPKAIIEPNLSAQEFAQQEAFEEAGIRGKVIPESIGEYQYSKWGGICNVKVFPFLVEEIADEYPESNFRKRTWVNIDNAVSLVDIKKLEKLIKQLPVFLNNKIKKD